EELVGTRFAKLFDHFGLEKDGHELASEYEAILSTQGQTIDGAEEMLHTLRDAGYQLYAATNGITTIQKGRLEHSPVTKYFKKVFISEELKVAKPSPLFFERVAKDIPDFDKETAVMIGDSLTADIQGGINAGIDTIWMNLARKENRTAVKPTVEVRSYAELLEFLV
ncbi:HAD-IA family hydrolase, partial [uncultured Granulicatella sp.]|uniref:HAD family hydrolase n=1 Tax=uncultured Granulicatella sp. TaxID=316089 RepID=UPI002803A1AF